MMSRIFVIFEKCYPKRDTIANGWVVKLLYCVRPWTKQNASVVGRVLIPNKSVGGGSIPSFSVITFCKRSFTHTEIGYRYQYRSDVFWFIVMIIQMTILKRYSKLGVYHAVSPCVRILYMPWLFERVNAWLS